MTTEITFDMDTLSGFEKSLMLCLIEQFETLRSFAYPDNIGLIKEELTAIQNNFPMYLSLLKKRQGLCSDKEEIKVNPDLLKQNICDLAFHENFVFCTSTALPSSSDDTSASKLSRKNILRLNSLYVIDDQVVENAIDLLYQNYQSYEFRRSGSLSLVTQLCESPQFEVKLLDFCIFFLYCPDHLQLIKDSKEEFPYKNVLNVSAPLPLNEVYSQVASNIMEFFERYVRRKEYLVYQPRLIFEKYGLKSIQALKTKSGFYENTPCMVSLCDLIIGLLGIEQFNPSTTLFTKLEGLINDIFSLPTKFKLLKIKPGNEDLNQPRVLSNEPCKKLLELGNIENALKVVPEIVVQNMNTVLDIFFAKSTQLTKAFEENNAQLKEKGKNATTEFKQDDITIVLAVEKDLAAISSILAALSNVLSSWMLERQKDEPSENAPKDNEAKAKFKDYESCLKTFNTEVLCQKYFEDLILLLFEFANYIPFQDRSYWMNKFDTMAFLVAKACFSIYNLVCIREMRTADSSTSKDLINLMVEPCSITSSEFPAEPKDSLKIQKTFSEIRRERQFDFDMLFSNMVKTNQAALSKMISQDSARFNQVTLICKRMPWVLDLTVKKKSLM